MFFYHLSFVYPLDNIRKIELPVKNIPSSLECRIILLSCLQHLNFPLLHYKAKVPKIHRAHGFSWQPGTCSNMPAKVVGSFSAGCAEVMISHCHPIHDQLKTLNTALVFILGRRILVKKAWALNLNWLDFATELFNGSYLHLGFLIQAW